MILFLSPRGAAQIPGSGENLVKMILLQSPRGALKRYSEAGEVPLKKSVYIHSLLVVKRHFENEVHLKDHCVYRKKEIHKGKCERREHAFDMRIAILCYAVYLIGSFKRNFEQETLKSILNGLDVGDINHISEC